MRTKTATLLSAMLVATLTNPFYAQAASQSMEDVYKNCEKEAESNEVTDQDIRNYLKQCMTDNGLTSADADTTLEELGPPADNAPEGTSGS